MPKKTNETDFITNASTIHENFYNYSKIHFKGLTKEITIICPQHGDFIQLARSHLKGYGCEKCGIEQTKSKKIEKSKKIFFEEAPIIHKHFYDYSNSDYKGTRIKVSIQCPKHGPFLQRPAKHLTGQGCNKCGEERTADGQKTPLDIIIKQFKEKHGEEHYNYDYVDYINIDTPVKIHCNIHKKIFLQTSWNHLSGSGCKECGIEKRSIQKINLASSKFWEVANKDEHFDFSQFIYKKCIIKSTLICKKCNGHFETCPNNYLAGNGCPFCINKTELKLYEILIGQYLITRQNKYEWCTNIKTKCYLPFDFCIEEYNIIIELDGIQHFQKVKHFKNTPEEQNRRDLYKQKCANDNNYSVIRIYQEDVYYDTFDWLTKIIETIEHIKNVNIVQNVYISKNDEYKDFYKIL